VKCALQQAPEYRRNPKTGVGAPVLASGRAFWTAGLLPRFREGLVSEV
jgi:hypothetical protein